MDAIVMARRLNVLWSESHTLPDWLGIHATTPLDRDVAMQLFIVPQINGAHPAFALGFEDIEFAKG
jgi:hypothetical protein